MDEKIRGMWTCEVCGREFALMHEDRYTVRDEQKEGLVAAFESSSEPLLWDAFDCPYCGCQNRVKERKRVMEVSDPVEVAEGYACGECGLSEVCPLAGACDERDEEDGR